ncbi:hypothetical protein H0E87_028386 [Populus deltoides]|uniref:Uncharacterized protein n=1 Tax=Populus deltoides TaxID=3696 RepID=A0A8T2WTU8_POPDE|nr:hypothetical protein H0E87_028386 [Populus deltoides]
MFSAVTCYGLVSGRIRIYKMHLPEFRNMVSSRTVEAPCSFNEDTFPREKSVETFISMGVPLTKQTEILISSDCVRKASSAHKGLPHWEAMKEAMQQQLNPNHYWRTDIEGLEKPVIQEGDIMSH